MRDCSDINQTIRELRDENVIYHFSRDYLRNVMKDAADAIEELLDELTTIRKQFPRWISVEERLPEVEERVLACAGIPGDLIVYDGARWNGEEWEAEAEAVYDYWTTIDDPVTHWMPLPEPPKEDKP